MSRISLDQGQEVGGTLFEIDPQRYTILKAVGKGAFGVVCAAKDNLTGEIVAIKKISRVFENAIAAKRVLREVKLMRHMRCLNLIGIKDIPLPENPSGLDEIYLVSEFMDTDLHSVIQSAQVLSDKYLQYFTFQMLKGLKYMHDCNVLHRDMKPTNILVKKNCDLKICDLGLARVDKGITKDDTSVFMTEHVVTRWYRAPEVILSWGRYTKAIDIWSAGCILAELIGRTPLFPGKNYIHQLEMITDVLGKPTDDEINMFENEKARKFMRSLPNKKKVSFSALFPSASDAAVDLLARMLVFDPNKRITAAEAMHHPYIAMLTREDTEEDPYYRPPSCASADFETIDDIDSDTVRSLLWEEVCDFHRELEERGLGSSQVQVSTVGHSENIEPEVKKVSVIGNGAVSPVGYDRSGKAVLHRTTSASEAKANSPMPAPQQIRRGSSNVNPQQSSAFTSNYSKSMIAPEPSHHESAFSSNLSSLVGAKNAVRRDDNPHSRRASSGSGHPVSSDVYAAVNVRPETPIEMRQAAQYETINARFKMEQNARRTSKNSLPPPSDYAPHQTSVQRSSLSGPSGAAARSTNSNSSKSLMSTLKKKLGGGSD